MPDDVATIQVVIPKTLLALIDARTDDSTTRSDVVRQLLAKGVKRPKLAFVPGDGPRPRKDAANTLILALLAKHPEGLSRVAIADALEGKVRTKSEPRKAIGQAIYKLTQQGRVGVYNNLVRLA